MSEADAGPRKQPILRTRASVVCRRGDVLLTVRAVDPVTGRQYLFLPGGAVEPGESPDAAAARETLEETGYRAAVDPASEAVADYCFRWSGKDYDCRTHFFRAALVDPAAAPAAVHDDPYLVGVEWVKVADVDDVFAYHDDIRRAVRALLAGTPDGRAGGADR